MLAPDALYEYEGIDKRHKQTYGTDGYTDDAQRSWSYNAPIVVYENKYYKYEDPEYSITQTPLNEQDLKTMSEAVEVLRQFKRFLLFYGNERYYQPLGRSRCFCPDENHSCH